MCILSILIYFDYLNKFRGKDIYIIENEGVWEVCNEGDEICFGNGNYGFETLHVRSNWEEFIANPNELFKKNFEDFKKWKFLNMGVSVCFFLQFILQQVFNICRDKKKVNRIPITIQLQANFVFAIVNTIVFQLIAGMMDYTDFLPKNAITKDYIDNLVAFVLILAFGRFFLLFLVIPDISKMLLTIFTMLIDVMPFAFIMVCYIVFAS